MKRAINSLSYYQPKQIHCPQTMVFRTVLYVLIAEDIIVLLKYVPFVEAMGMYNEIGKTVARARLIFLLRDQATQRYR
jgi:hypothetical protein